MITRDPNRRSSARARCFPLFPGRPAGDGTLELVGPSMNENSDIPFQVKASGTDRRSSVAADATSRPDSPESPSVRSIHSLAVQVPLLLVVALSLVVAVGAWGLRTIVLRSFERLEVANAELDLRRFANAIDHEVALLDDQLSDAIVRRSRMSDVERLDVIPLGTSPAAHRSPEVACIFDRQGALVSTDSHDPAGDLLQMINPTDFCALTEDDPAMAQRLIREPAAGLYDAEGTFFVVAARPHPPRPGADVAGDVLLFDEVGDHPAAVAADALAGAGCMVELVTPDRTFLHDLGPTTSAVALRNLAANGVTFTCLQELHALTRDGNRVSACLRHVLTGEFSEHLVDHVVVEQGSIPMDDLYHDLKPVSKNLGQLDHNALINGMFPFIDVQESGQFHLARIGDAVASRNMHGAILDALRICNRF